MSSILETLPICASFICSQVFFIHTVGGTDSYTPGNLGFIEWWLGMSLEDWKGYSSSNFMLILRDLTVTWNLYFEMTIWTDSTWAFHESKWMLKWMECKKCDPPLHRKSKSAACLVSGWLMQTKYLSELLTPSTSFHRSSCKVSYWRPDLMTQIWACQYTTHPAFIVVTYTSWLPLDSAFRWCPRIALKLPRHLSVGILPKFQLCCLN